MAILQKAGLDMTQPDPYRDFVVAFGRTMDEIEKLI